MKELNLEVGQKVWSIQLGKCEVVDDNIDDDFPIMCKSINSGKSSFYTRDGKFSYDSEDFYPSLFESNPFTSTIQLPTTKMSLSENKPENKAELINALCSVIAVVTDNEMDKIAKEKLHKLLESI